MNLRTIVVLAVVGCARFAWPGDSPPSDIDRVAQEKAEQIHTLLWERFIHPETNMLYDYIAPLSAKDRWAHLPTPADIAAKIPNTTGWGTGMEDCCINGGAYLGCLTIAYDVSKNEKIKEQARRIYHGLRTLGTLGPRKGFVARGVTPDGKGFYSNSSVDQYTLYIYGLWAYVNSPIATEDEKKEIKTIIADVCARVEDDGFDILCADGKPGLVSDIGVIRSDRSSRLLALYQFGAALTGDEHIKAIYGEKLRENNYARLKDIATPSRVDILPWKAKQMVYGILQNQVSLLPLLYLEKDFGVKAAYLEAIRLNARLVEERMLGFREYTPAIHTDEYVLGGWRKGEPFPKNIQQEHRFVRGPSEALVVMLMAQGCDLVEKSPGLQQAFYGKYLKDTTAELLQKLDFDKMRTYSMLYAEMAYWLAAKQGLFTYSPKP